MFRLLIADDEQIERVVLYRTLSRKLEGQCELFQAQNGREALEIYQREKIQIAILDVEMPGINGIEVAERIRGQDKDCCLIFLTAFDEFAYARKAITVRALDYLLKPVDERELMASVEEAMRLAGERADRKAAGAGDENQPARPAAPEDVRQTKTNELIADYIAQHYMEDLSMQSLAELMNYSEPYFCRLFKQSFGQNFTSYLTEYRVSQAQRLLASPTVNIKDIGRAVGYPDSNYFAKMFKRITGQSPSEYRIHILQGFS